jgi:serine/threonine protein kinase
MIQKVAIKKINLLHGKDKFDEVMKSIKSEIEALLNLRNSPHILKLYDFVPDKTNSCVYLVL